MSLSCFFFFNDTATTEIYTLSLHDALPISMYRAWESERADALFHDPYARRLAGPQGETIVRTMPKARTWAWPMVVRTCLFDELILRAIERDGVGTVLNLAAGLDARPWRLPLSPALR